MPKELSLKRRKSFVIICDSVIPALLAYSILNQDENLSANLLIIIEYTESDGHEEAFFRVIEFIFKDFIGRKNVKVIRYYSNRQRRVLLLRELPWLVSNGHSSCSEIEVLISSASKLIRFLDGIFSTTILMHSLQSVTNLSIELSRLGKWKKRAISLVFKLQIYMSLAIYFNREAFGPIKKSILCQLHTVRIAVPFAMRSVESSLPVAFFSRIRNIKWVKYSPEIASVLQIFSDKNMQVIVIPITGDEPFEKRGNSYNLLKYRICYEQLFKALKRITNSSRRISVIYKSHKRYALLSTAEREMLINSTATLGVSDYAFLEGGNAELPVECFPVRSWDIIAGESSFALMTMSTEAQCFWADGCFSSLRLKGQQARTDINKEFSRLENLDIKVL